MTSQKQKAILLVSGGIDSPVAGYILKEKGFEVIGLHLSNNINKDEEHKVKKLMKKIGVKKLYTANASIYQKDFSKTKSRFRCILCKRMMFRLAQKIAEKENAKFIITGENLGQVASQTLDNLAVNDFVIEHEKFFVIRPLLTLDKNDIINIARKIGTFDISIEKTPSCPWLPSNPATKTTNPQLEKEEAKIDVDGLVKQTLKNSIIENI